MATFYFALVVSQAHAKRARRDFNTPSRDFCFIQILTADLESSNSSPSQIREGESRSRVIHVARGNFSHIRDVLHLEPGERFHIEYMNIEYLNTGRFCGIKLLVRRNEKIFFPPELSEFDLTAAAVFRFEYFDTALRCTMQYIINNASNRIIKPNIINIE